MKTDLVNTGALALTFISLFIVSELFYHFCKLQVELTRKLVHTGTGLITLFFPVMLSNHWFVLLLCGSFMFLLWASLKFGFLNSINAIERKSAGSLLYPVSVYICYLAFQVHHSYLHYYLPILILAICDPIAALTGKKWPKGKYIVGKDTKTLIGSGMFFLSAALLCHLLFILLHLNVSVTTVFFIASASCLTEALSKNGYDNLTIPIAVLLVLYLFPL